VPCGIFIGLGQVSGMAANNHAALRMFYLTNGCGFDAQMHIRFNLLYNVFDKK
jgi:hypothetical protein